MTQRRYDQPCSVAGALDRIGERWSLLIVRELMLGPMRFSELARAVGGAPTDVLTKRLRSFEDEGIVTRRELPAPASATVYELTELGRGLEAPMIALGRWGLAFQHATDAALLTPSQAVNALRVILQPPRDARLTVQVVAGGETFALWIAGGRVDAARGAADDPEITLTGAPGDVLAMLADPAWPGVEVAGSRDALAALREMVVLPEAIRAELAAARTAAA